MTPKKDNYALSADAARTLFLKEDQDQLIRKFHLRADPSFLYVRFLDYTYRIERNSGEIQRSSDNVHFAVDKSHQAALSIFDYLCWSRDDRRLSGRWVSLQTLGHSFHSNLLEGESGMYAKRTKMFAGQVEGLKKACERLNGQKMPVGDVSYILQLFDELPIHVQFWDEDDEFPAKFFFLWDANTEQYVHYETTYYLLELLLDRLEELTEFK